MNLPIRYDPACGPPGAQIAMFLLPPDRGHPTFAVVDTAGRERLRTSALPVAMFFTKALLLAEGEAWVRMAGAATARIAADGIDTDDPDTGWVRSLAATMEPNP